MKEIQEVCEFGSFRFDFRSGSLWRHNAFVALPPKSIELLKLLIRKRGEVVLKQEIFDAVWADTFVEDGVLTQNIYRLRQALGAGEDGKQMIETVARRGYRFNAPITFPAEPAAPEQRNTVERTDDRWPAVHAAAKPAAFAAAAVLLISLAAFFGYRYLATQPADQPQLELKFTRLTDNGDVSYLTISPDGKLVAYTRGFDLYVRDLASGRESKVPTGSIEKVGCIQIAPDNGSIYFGTVFNRDQKGEIFRLAMDGGTPEPIATDVWSGFSISPDGGEIAFVRKLPAQNSQVLIRKQIASGSETVAATITLPEEFYWNNYPAWSTDGQRIALVAITQTEHFSRIVTVGEGARQDVEFPDFRNIEQVVWTLSGDGLIAAANDGENFQLWRIGLADQSVRRITNDLDSYLGLAVSLDRKQLVARQRIYYSNIWIGEKDRLGDLRQITEGRSRNDGLNGLTWLDDHRVVYTSNDQKIRDWNIWLVDTATGEKRKLTGDTDVQNDFPTASPDGRTVYFASDRKGQRRIWRIDAAGGDPVQVTFGEDEVHQYPQVSPDGHFLYFIIKSGRESNIGRASLTERSVKELSGKKGSYVPGNFLSLSPDGKYLAFQNIAYPGASGPTPKLEIGIISTDDPSDLRFVRVNALRPLAAWGPDGTSIDFAGGNVKESELFRRPIAEDALEGVILSGMRSAIFQFAWSPGGERIAVARGQLLRDVVLISDFDR